MVCSGYLKKKKKKKKKSSENVKKKKKTLSFSELQWLELVGTVGASSTHPCVQAIPSLTVFKLVHVYFMLSRRPLLMHYVVSVFTIFYKGLLCTPVIDWRRGTAVIMVLQKKEGTYLSETSTPSFNRYMKKQH